MSQKDNIQQEEIQQEEIQQETVINENNEEATNEEVTTEENQPSELELLQQDLEKLASAMNDFSQAPIYIDDTSGCTLTDIRTKCRRLKTQQKDLGLIVIDYLQLMEGGGKDDRLQQISAISRGLKILAKELDVPIITLSQLSRAVEGRTDKRPMLSDLRESGSIEQDADMVWFIHRDMSAKEISEDWSDILWSERCKISLKDEESQKRFDDIENQLDITSVINQTIEKSGALGTEAVVLSVYDIIDNEDGMMLDTQVNLSDDKYRIPTYKLVEILGILIDNAREYYREKNIIDRDIKLLLCNDGNTVILEVINYCHKISNSDFEMMFAKGYSTKGLNRGLGLASLKKIVMEYEGNIMVENCNIDNSNWVKIRVEI